MPRSALPLLALVVSALTAGSLGGDDGAVREDRAVETLTAAREAAAEVESYHFDLQVRASAADGAGSVSARAQGRVNVTARRMAATTTVDGRSLDGYIAGWTADEQCPPRGLHWGQQNVTVENWTTATPLGRHLDLLSTGDLFYNGTETRDGTEVVHLSGRPSLTALRDRSDVAGPSLPDPDRIDRLELHARFDAETHRPVASRFSIAVSGNGQAATADLERAFDEFGPPVSVSVPAEARDAFFHDGCPD